MAIADDIEIQDDRDIRWVGGAATYSGEELDTFLHDLHGNAAAAGDDIHAAYKPTASNKIFTTIIELLNLYNVDDTLIQHLFDCSIIQNNGDDIYDGFNITATAGTHVEVIQNGALITPNFWTTGINADAGQGISHKFLLKVRSGGADIDGRRLLFKTNEFGLVYGERLVNGSARGVNPVALAGGTTDITNPTLLATVAAWTTITNTEGYRAIDANGDAANEFYFSEYNSDIYNQGQLFERIKWITRRGTAETLYGISADLFRGVTHEIVIDTPTGTFSAFEAVSWSGGTGQMLAINSTTAGTKMWIQLLTGVAPVDNDTITGGTSSATADMNVTITERPISVPFCGVSTGTALKGAYGFGIEAADLTKDDGLIDLDGTAITPPNNVVWSQNVLVNGDDYVIITPPGKRVRYDNEAGGPFVVGEELTFTSPAGTADVRQVVDKGAFGELVIGPMKTGTTPADNSTIAGGTSLATADVDGTPDDDIDLGEFTLNGALTGGAVTVVTMNDSSPDSQPAAGSIRIQRDDGVYTTHPYTGHVAGTTGYTITSHDFSTNNASNGNNAHSAYFDGPSASTTATFNTKHVSDLPLFIRVVTNSGAAIKIKPFESVGTLGSNGGSANTVRTPK